MHRTNPARRSMATRLMLIPGMICASVVIASSPASATTGGYPDYDAVDCSAQHGSFSWCKGGSPLSPRTYGYRNCTDWVAWRLESQGITNHVRNRGNANQWDDSSTGVTLTDIPEVGDAAVWNSGLFGHVAYVEEVRPKAGGGYEARVSEYNQNGDGTFRNDRWVVADKYVDFNGVGTPVGASIPPPTGSSPTRADILMTAPAANGNVDYMFGASTGDGTFNLGYSSIVNRVDPLFTEMADVNGDGKDDLILVEDAGNNQVNYLYGLSLGDGTFNLGYATGLTLQPRPSHVMAGDFNGDGKGDIVTGLPDENAAGNTYYMFAVSYGNGSFGLGYTNLGSRPEPLFTDMADVNGDGKDDVVIVESEGSTQAHYLYGVSNGSGGFSLGYAGGLTWQPRPGHVMAGDFNGDGKDDIVMAIPDGGTGNVYYMFGVSYGNGTFGPGYTSVAGRPGPVVVDMGDFNGDGKDDLVFAENTGSGTVNYMFGVSYGNGTFGLGYAVNLDGQPAPTHMMIGDFNNS